MTIASLLTNTSSGFYRWNNPAVWSTGVVPNTSDADVTVPVQPTFTSLIIDAGEVFSARSYTQTGSASDLILDGSLTVAGAASIYDLDLAGGVLTAGSLTLSSGGYYGSINVAGRLLATDAVEGEAQSVNLRSIPSTLSIVAGSLTNTGAIFAEGPNITVTVTVTGGPGAATNLSGGTLTGGNWYGTGGGVLDLNLGGTIMTDAATLDGGSVFSYDSVSGTYLPLQATLQAVAAGGTLDSSQSFTAANAFTVAAGGILRQYGQTFTATQALTDAGTVILSDASIVAQAGLDVAAGGQLSGSGAVSGAMQDDGTVMAGVTGGSTPSRLILPTVSGAGLLAIGTASATGSNGAGGGLASTTLELSGSSSNTVQFLDGTGVLQLDTPSSYTGSIIAAAAEFASATAATAADQILLGGIAATNVTGESYVPSGSGGTLTISEGYTQQSLTFVGRYTAGSFALSAGPALASGQPSLDITVTPALATVTLGVGGATSTRLITNSMAVSGTFTAGSAVSVSVDGAAVATPAYTAAAGATTGGYSVTSPALTPGAHQVTASTSNAGGATAAAISLYELGTLSGGVTNSDVGSFDIGQLLGRGYAFQFLGGTQEVHLTNGTVSVGTDTNAAYVQRLYEGLLGRAGDVAGLTSYATALASGTSSVTVANAFLSSAEYQTLHGSQTNAQFVTSLYQGMLGRSPSAADLSGWTSQLAVGASRGFVAAAFAISSEARSHLSATTADIWMPDANGELITQLYQTGLGRDPVHLDVSTLEQQLAAGLPLQQLAQAIASSAEFAADHNGQSPASFVTSLYQFGLGRTPGSTELVGWAGQIQGGATPASVLLGIATSAEAYAHLSPAV